VSVLSEMRRRQAAYYYREAADLARRGQHAQALAALNRVIALAPGHAEAHYLRGFELSHLSRHGEALADFDQVTAL
jgi:protein O-GlcNAc transferase